MTTAAPATQPLTSVLARWAPLMIVLGVVAFHAFIAAQSVGPFYLFDEVGYLGNAYVLAHPGATWEICGSGYSAGWSAVLAPLWPLLRDPGAVYGAAVLLTAGAGALVMWPAARVASLLGAGRVGAVAIGALVTVPATRALMSNYVIAENALALCVAFAAWAALAYARNPRWQSALGLGIAAGAAFAVHQRAVPFALVSGAWLAWRAGRQAAHRIAGLAALLTLGLTGMWLQSWTNPRVFPADERLTSTLESVLGGSAWHALRVALGQAFYQGIGWSVLTVVGIAAVALGWWRGRSRADDALAPWHGWLAAGVAAQLALSVAMLSGFGGVEQRLDVIAYGRYMDPFLVPVAVVGAVWILRGLSARMRWGAVAAVAATAAAFLAVVPPTLADDAPWVPFAAPALLPFVDFAGRDFTDATWWALGLGSVAAAALVAVLARWPRAALAALAVAFVGTTAYADASLVPFEEQVRSRPPVVEVTDALGATTVGMSAENLQCYTRSKANFWYADRDLRFFSPGVDPVPTPVVLGPAEWPAAEQAGAVRVPDFEWEGVAVWVFPTADA